MLRQLSDNFNGGRRLLELFVLGCVVDLRDRNSERGQCCRSLYGSHIISCPFEVMGVLILLVNLSGKASFLVLRFCQVASLV